jgi:hypothetical protein
MVATKEEFDIAEAFFKSRKLPEKMIETGLL